MAAGYAAMLSGKPDRAKDYFWAYANIVPEAQDVDVAMARIGDILLKQEKRDAAREIYHRASEASPPERAASSPRCAWPRKAFSISHPSPTWSLFSAARNPRSPEQIYNDILEHADSFLAPVARLKLAMWNLWNKKYAASLEDVGRFQNDYPEHSAAQSPSGGRGFAGLDHF